MHLNRQIWFKVKCNLSFNTIVERLNNFPYGEDNPIGFDVTEIQEEKVLVRYIERQNITEELRDPFGAIEKITTIKYVVFHFEVVSFDKYGFLLKIKNSPVSLKGFVKTFSNLFQSEFFISKIQISVEDIYTYLVTSNLVGRFSVKKLMVSSIPFGEKTVATINLKSSDNAYKEFKKKYTDNNYKYETISLILRFESEWETIEISSSGSIVCTSGLDTLVENYIKLTQPKSV